MLIAQALADRGLNLVLVARSAKNLEKVAIGIRERSRGTVSTVEADLAKPEGLPEVWDRIKAQTDVVDVLINNAGMESALTFSERPPEEIATINALNLTAPMVLSRLALTDMIQRHRGHIVNMSSMAGLVPTAYEDTYSATKFGVVGFTRSLRLTSQDCGWGVGVSAVCPGFMEGTGMYDDMQQELDVRASRLMPPKPASAIGPAVIDAIEQDRPEVTVMKGAPRLVATLAAASPRTFERLSARLDLAAMFRTVAQSH